MLMSYRLWLISQGPCQPGRSKRFTSPKVQPRPSKVRQMLKQGSLPASQITSSSLRCPCNPGKTLVILERVYYLTPGGPFQNKHNEGKRGENTEGGEEPGRPRFNELQCVESQSITGDNSSE